MAEQKEYLTQEKYDELKQELDQLRTVRRREIAENLEYAKSLGDLSENAEYQEAREMQANIEDRIAKLEGILKSAEIMSAHGTAEAGIGSTVTVERMKDGKNNTYKIVGTEESDIIKGKISLHSPLGEAILGKKKGQSFKFKTPGGEAEYKIISIE